MKLTIRSMTPEVSNGSEQVFRIGTKRQVLINRRMIPNRRTEKDHAQLKLLPRPLRVRKPVELY
ncbi:hypothetical protein SAMN05428953_105298 [Mesorhizobium muleiense]|uniref:Uncharacterized protein n=1 Tax=Mesorhizobium muleiense TaxID=1004279 RepID=A0A1G8SRL4_9HYPH|nr:hypothetical protein SAMN05428953_105298 [Mesorhizobium muleiense]